DPDAGEFCELLAVQAPLRVAPREALRHGTAWRVGRHLRRVRRAKCGRGAALSQGPLAKNPRVRVTQFQLAIVPSALWSQLGVVRRGSPTVSERAHSTRWRVAVTCALPIQADQISPGCPAEVSSANTRAFLEVSTSSDVGDIFLSGTE